MLAPPSSDGLNGATATKDQLLSHPRTPTLPTATTDLTHGLAQTALQAIEVDGTVSGNVPVKLENFKHLGSYSWIDAPQPTILVPGSPPEWRDRPCPFKVAYDSGLQVFDPMGYYMRSASKLIPLFRAVDVVTEDNADNADASVPVDWAAVDFVLDRSSLQKLWRWAQIAEVLMVEARAVLPRKTTWSNEGSPGDPGADEPLEAKSKQSAKRTRDMPEFRLDLQLGGKKTVLVERWDTRTHQYIRPPRGGCRKNFDAATTAPRRDCGDNYNRIVQYDLEGLRLVVRCEIDACVKDDEDPSDLLAGLSLASSSSPPPPSPPPPPPSPSHSDTTITVLRGGTPVPQSSLIEIATRSAKSLYAHKWAETYTQLFLSQTPYLYVALHQTGTFTEVVKLAREDAWLERYASDVRMRRSLRELVRVLEDVQHAVQAYGPRGRLSLVCRGGKLELFECASEAGRLPDRELARFGI
ncbi:hypothetical protein BC628DRAFT_602365 [Trametes gibbosa]|nr:hypothetical protein BC628DRAFT_602365 [Trametes gibbosa]